MPYHTISYHTRPYHTIPCHTIPRHTMPYHIILFHTLPHLATPHHTIPYHTIPYLPEGPIKVRLWPPRAQSVHLPKLLLFHHLITPRLELGATAHNDLHRDCHLYGAFCHPSDMICADSNGFTSSGYSQPFVPKSELGKSGDSKGD